MKYTIHDLHEQLVKKEISAVELTKKIIAHRDSVEGDIHAYLSTSDESALSVAAKVDAKIAAGEEISDLAGIPGAIKDNMCIKGETCTAASRMLEHWVSPYDATVIEKLKGEDYISLGKTNMDEFAMGSSCENSAFRKTRNPRDPNRVPGGSSGGSAACVAASFAPAALGSDTGGSIRQPAAFCGVVGLKPTYGRVSRYGLVAFASSLDQIGPMTHDVLDAGILLDAIAGFDPMDSTSLPEPAGGFADAVRSSKGALRGMRIGLPKEYFTGSGLSAGVEKVMQQAIEKIRAEGAVPVEVSLPHTKYAVAVYYIVATAEASANLARFDGIRYGKRVEGRDLTDTYFKSRGAGFGPEVQRRILLGTYVLSSGYYDAYYLRAQKVRTLIRRDFEEAFRQCDLMLTPVTPTSAFKFGEKSDPLQMYLSDIFTIALNLSGNCGISVPGGVDCENGMPVGVQFLAPALAEARLLRAADAFLA